jgi:hypothetical protein
MSALLVTAATSEVSGINPFVVGGGVLLLLGLAVLALLSFGAGRDHS